MVAVTPDANPDDPADGEAAGDDPGDAAALAAYAATLAEEMAAAIPGWIEGLVVTRIQAARGSVTDDERAAAVLAGQQAGAEAGPELRALLATDIDQQASTPLAIARHQVARATEVLRQAGIPAVARDPFVQRQDPGDDYDLTPGSFADIAPALAEPGMTWGAAKAHVHLARRRRAGQR